MSQLGEVWKFLDYVIRPCEKDQVAIEMFSFKLYKVNVRICRALGWLSGISAWQVMAKKS